MLDGKNITTSQATRLIPTAATVHCQELMYIELGRAGEFHSMASFDSGH